MKVENEMIVLSDEEKQKLSEAAEVLYAFLLIANDTNSNDPRAD